MRRERGGNGRGGSKWIRPEKRLAIYHRDGFACVYCGRSVKMDEIELSLDHVVPRALGGSNEADNLVTSCVSCNAARQAGNRRWLAALRLRGVDTAAIRRRVRAARRRRVDLAAGKRIRAARRRDDRDDWMLFMSVST